MSRIGKLPITIPSGVSVTVAPSKVSVKGPQGEQHVVIPSGIGVQKNETSLEITKTHNDRSSRALQGLIRAHIANDITGVTTGWTKKLELSGVGYRASVSGANLVLSVGFSHQVTITPPAGISFQVAEGKIVVSGVNKQLVGQITAEIRSVRKPEPYKGKGIKYVGEVVRRKAGKSAKGAGAASGGK